MTLLLGIDIGTSSVKAILYETDNAELLAVAGQEYPLHIPQPGYAEQDPDDWWQATQATVRQIVQQAGRQDVAAISFSGHMHGTVLLDSAKQVLHPAVIWADQRTTGILDALLATVGEDDYIATTGTRPAAGFYGATLLWFKQHQPDLLDNASHAILPKDYVRWCMTGEIGTDVSDAAGTGIFAVAEQAWATEIVAKAGLPEAILPPVLQSWEVAGQLTPEAAEALSLPAGIPVVAGCADQPAQALGNGIVASGVASVTVGSGGQVFVPLGSDMLTRMDGRVHVFNHAAPGYYALGAILSAGLSLRWLRDLLGLSDTADAYTILAEEATAISTGAEGLLFLPYLNGERTPHFDGCARGGFIGLASHHTRAHMTRAVMEGVAFAMRQALEIAEALGEPAEMLIGSGGGVDSMIWRQILTDVIGRPLHKSLAQEQASVGAALLAGVGTHALAASDDVAQQFAAVHEIAGSYDTPTEPRPAQHTLYNERYTQFVELYSRLQADMHRLAGC